MMHFVDGISGLPKDAQEQLKKLSPFTYTGNAAQQAKELSKHLK